MSREFAPAALGEEQSVGVARPTLVAERSPEPQQKDFTEKKFDLTNPHVVWSVASELGTHKSTAENTVTISPFETPDYHMEGGQTVHIHDFSEEIEEKGYKNSGVVGLKTEAHGDFLVSLYTREKDGVLEMKPYHPAYGVRRGREVPAGHKNFQDVIAGIAGFEGLSSLGLKPKSGEISEPASVFGALKHLDALTSESGNLGASLQKVRETYSLTPESLEGEKLSGRDYKNFLSPNIENNSVKLFVTELMGRMGDVPLTRLANELSQEAIHNEENAAYKIGSKIIKENEVVVIDMAQGKVPNMLQRLDDHTAAKVSRDATF